MPAWVAGVLKAGELERYCSGGEEEGGIYRCVDRKQVVIPFKTAVTQRNKD